MIGHKIKNGHVFIFGVFAHCIHIGYINQRRKIAQRQKKSAEQKITE